MSGVLERTLGILELLSRHGEGLELAAIADQLDIPRSGTHRLLADLARCGYVRQTRDHGDYILTTKLVAMGLTYLSNSGIVDIAQPLLNHLAEVSGELARLSVVDGERLTWVARAQGARQGLRYDPDIGSDARLSCSSSGWAWLSVKNGKLEISKTANGESPLVHGATPILGVDVWEHSYYIDYRNRRPDYLKAFVDHLVNWEYVDQLFSKA